MIQFLRNILNAQVSANWLETIYEENIILEKKSNHLARRLADSETSVMNLVDQIREKDEEIKRLKKSLRIATSTRKTRV